MAIRKKSIGPSLPNRSKLVQGSQQSGVVHLCRVRKSQGDDRDKDLRREFGDGKPSIVPFLLAGAVAVVLSHEVSKTRIQRVQSHLQI